MENYVEYCIYPYARILPREESITYPRRRRSEPQRGMAVPRLACAFYLPI